MLTIHYGDMENVIYNTSVYFDNIYSPEWFQDAFAQRIIKSIDKGGVWTRRNKHQDPWHYPTGKAIGRN